MRILWIVGIVFCFFSCAVKPPEITNPVDEPTTQLTTTLTPDTPRKDSTLNPLSTIMLIEASSAKHLGEIDKAIQLYNRAIEVDQYNDAAHFELATIYQQKEQFDVDSAVKNIRQAYNIDPDNEVYQIMLGRLLVDTNQADEGVQLFETLTENNPKRRDYAFDLAFAYEKADRVQDAIQVFENIENTYGYDPEINYQKHVLFFEMGDHQRGIEEIKEIVDSNPEYVAYSLFVARYYLETGELAEAEKYAAIGFKQENDNTEAFELLSISHISQDNKTRFAQLLEEVVQSDLTVDQKVIHFNSLIEIYQQSKEWREIILEQSKNLAQLHPDRAEPIALFGDFLYLDDQNEAAVPVYKQSLSIRDDVYEVWTQVMDIYVFKQNYQDLGPFATQASKRFPEEAFPSYLAAYANFRTKDFGNAIEVLERSTKAEYATTDYDIPMMILLADSYYENAQQEQAYLTYDKILLKDPDNSHVLNNYSFHLGESKQNLDKAKKMAARALELNPGDANTLDTYGWVLYQSGDFIEAEELFKNAVAQDPDSAQILEHYGDALFQNQKIEEALKQWARALLLDTTNVELKSKIQQNQ